MSQKPRLIVPEIPVHITQRGNRREALFKNDEDKESYIRFFQFIERNTKLNYMLGV